MKKLSITTLLLLISVTTQAEPIPGKLYSKEEMQEFEAQRNKDPKYKYINESCSYELRSLEKIIGLRGETNYEIKYLEKKLKKLKEAQKRYSKELKESNKLTSECSKFHNVKYNSIQNDE